MNYGVQLFNETKVEVSGIEPPCKKLELCVEL